VKSLPIDNAPALHFLYGFLKLYSVPKLTAPRTTEDVLYPIQGIYILQTGESALLTTPSPNHRVFLVLPLVASNTSDASPSSRRLMALDDPQQFGWAREQQADLSFPFDDAVADAPLTDNLDSLIASHRLASAFSFFSEAPPRSHVHRLLRNEPPKSPKVEPVGSVSPTATPSEKNPTEASDSANASASISVTVKQSAKSRILPGDTFKRFAVNGAHMERYRIGSSGLELLLVVSQPYSGSTKTNSKEQRTAAADAHLGGFGYDSLPSNFKLFQQSHEASRAYQQSSKCTFAVRAHSSDLAISRREDKASANLTTDLLALGDVGIFGESDPSVVSRRHRHRSIKSLQSQASGPAPSSPSSLPSLTLSDQRQVSGERFGPLQE
jgi:hypothetical protein